MSAPFDSLEWWHGQLDGRRSPAPAVRLRAPLRRAQSSGAGAFLGLGDDNRQYWVKVPNNPQGNQVLVNEVIVAEVGQALGAPVRNRILIEIPPEITSWRDYPAPRSHSTLIGHASLHVPDAVDDDDLRYTRRDGNAQRHASLVGIWDLCVGEDPQWLYETSANYSVWSYDHGFWFTTGEGDWNQSVLEQILRVNATFPAIPRGIDLARLAAMAEDIEALTPQRLLAVVSAVPVEWGTSNGDLESMAWFLYRRRIQVAERLRRRADALPDHESTGPNP